MISDIRYAFIPNSDKALWELNLTLTITKSMLNGTVKTNGQ